MFPKPSRTTLKNIAQVDFFFRGTALFCYRFATVSWISFFLENLGCFHLRHDDLGWKQTGQ